MKRVGIVLVVLIIALIAAQIFWKDDEVSPDGTGAATQGNAETAVAVTSTIEDVAAAAASIIPEGFQTEISLVEPGTGMFVVRGPEFEPTRLNVIFVEPGQTAPELQEWSTARPISLPDTDAPQSSTGAVTSNKAIARAFYDAFNSGDIPALQDLLSADFRDHMNPVEGAGKDELIAQRTENGDNLTLSVLAIVGQGDLVGVRLLVSAGNPPAPSPGGDILRFEDGKLIERWRLNY